MKYMPEDDMISVVVPIYNVEKYIRKCIDSIKKQTYRNIEIILVDDGSPDKCGEICDEYAESDKRIKVIHKRNGGLSDARNVGIDIAKGKYITFVDSDDYVEEDYVMYLYSLIKKYNTEMSICSYYVEDYKNKRIDLGAKYQEKALEKIECISRMLCENGFAVSAWAKMYNLELFQDIRYPVGKLCEDNGTTYKLIEQCDLIAYGNESKYIYIKREDSIMNSKFSKKKLDLIELTDKMAEDLYPKFPELQDVVIKRKIQSRFSIIRQILFSEYDEANIKIAKDLRKEIVKGYGKQFFTNSKLDKRDRVAFVSILLGIKVYKLNWSLYQRLRNI